ncbi:hypothetical protein CDIK_3165 [Cucumispora dikerogammari]|nr:hypothetical protein CDIK_3165 [Cucumispora dikerogammari]
MNKIFYLIFFGTIDREIWQFGTIDRENIYKNMNFNLMALLIGKLALLIGKLALLIGKLTALALLIGKLTALALLIGKLTALALLIGKSALLIGKPYICNIATDCDSSSI